MKNCIKLTREMVLFLSFIGIIGNMVYSHTWIDNDTDRAAWLAALVGILLVTPFALWILYLGRSNPNCTIFDILEAGMGKFLSKVANIIFILINIAVAVAQLNMFTEMLKTFFLLLTPPWVIMMFLVLVSAMFVNSGIMVWGRVVEILCAFGLLNYLSSFLFAIPNQFHIKYVLPIFDTSVSGFIKGAVFITGNASEFLLLLMIIVRFIPEPLKHYKWVAKGIIFAGIIFPLAIMVITGMMSSELASRIAFGGVNAAILIQIGEYVRGLEIFVFGTYQFIAIGKTLICMYCSWESAKNITNNWKPGFQLLLIAFLILLPSVWLNSYNKAYFIAVFLGNYVILPFSIVILLLSTIGMIIKNIRTGSRK